MAEVTEATAVVRWACALRTICGRCWQTFVDQSSPISAQADAISFRVLDISCSPAPHQVALDLETVGMLMRKHAD